MRSNSISIELKALQRLTFRQVLGVIGPLIIGFLLVAAGCQLAFAQHHPQKKLFGPQSGKVTVGLNPNAHIRLINPNFGGEMFGTFSLPTDGQFLADNFDSNELLEIFAVGKEYSQNRRTEFVPPETGRGLLLAPSAHPAFRDILIKGTGAVEKFTTNNKLRPAHLGFDGYFEVSEAIRDLTTAEVLESAGVLVAHGLVVIDHNRLVQREGLPGPVRMGTYVRAFRVQTRLSNLAELTPSKRKLAIDDAIDRIQMLHQSRWRMDYVEYFHYMLQELAANVAIYQAIGFTQNSLHNGQVTLAGEMADLGVGTFSRPTKKGEMNSKYPWFRYERQPVLIQNMLYKTHSVKAEPEPVELSPDSESVKNQNTLYSYIRSFDPEAAKQIEAMNPVKMFWEAYAQNYRNFDSPSFKEDVVEKLDNLYNWQPKQALAKIPASVRNVLTH